MLLKGRHEEQMRRCLVPLIPLSFPRVRLDNSDLWGQFVSLSPASTCSNTPRLTAYTRRVFYKSPHQRKSPDREQHLWKLPGCCLRRKEEKSYEQLNSGCVCTHCTPITTRNGFMSQYVCMRSIWRGSGRAARGVRRIDAAARRP